MTISRCSVTTTAFSFPGVSPQCPILWALNKRIPESFFSVNMPLGDSFPDSLSVSPICPIETNCEVHPITLRGGECKKSHIKLGLDWKYSCVPIFSQGLLGQQLWRVLAYHFRPRTDMSKVACYIVAIKLAGFVAKLPALDSLLVI